MFSPSELFDLSMSVMSRMKKVEILKTYEYSTKETNVSYEDELERLKALYHKINSKI